MIPNCASGRWQESLERARKANETEVPEGQDRDQDGAAGPDPQAKTRQSRSRSAARRRSQVPSRSELASQRTHEAAMKAIDAETAERNAKIARLRAARMARDAGSSDDESAADPDARD